MKDLADVCNNFQEFNENLKEEHDKFNDILQLNFTDAYRNMTYKHLSGYWWVKNNCENVQFVLKSDDDQAIDVYHLKSFVKEFIPTETSHFYLCIYMQDQVPHRNPENKWYVTREEYSRDYYPEYCAGWAYVTNIKTISSVLGKILIIKLRP